MARTLSILSFVLFFINLSVSSVNIFFSIKVYKNDGNSVNLRGTKERLLEINPNYFLEKEIENPKELRKLSTDTLRLSVIIINVCSFLFILMLSFSFCATCEECSDDGLCVGGTCICCVECRERDRNYFCPKDKEKAGEAIVLCILLLILIIFVGLFYIVRACGKTLSRMISIIILFLANVALAVLSLYLGSDKFNILLASFSAFAALCDLIVVILICCLDLNRGTSNNQDYYNTVQQTQQLQPVQPYNTSYSNY